MMRTLPVAAALAGLVMFVPNVQGESSASFYTGFSDTSGDYGIDEDTTVVRLPLGVSWDTGGFTLFGEASYISADGYVSAIQQPAAARDSSRLQIWRAGPPQKNEEMQFVSGWDDHIMGARFRLSPSTSSSHASMTVSTSAPTGVHEQGLRFDGDGISDGFEDVYAFVSSNTGYDNTSDLSAGAGISWVRSSDAAFDDQADATLTSSWLLSDTVYLGNHASFGLTKASSDYEAAFALSFAPALWGAP